MQQGRAAARQSSLPALVAVLEAAAGAPHSGVALEATAEAQLPDAVAAPHARKVLDVGQNVPATACPHKSGLLALQRYPGRRADKQQSHSTGA